MKSIESIIRDPNFKGFGKFLFPLSAVAQNPKLTIDRLNEAMPWHSHYNPALSYDVLNVMKTQILKGTPAFYSIYTKKEKKKDPSLENTGLFYFPGKPGKPFAIANAGGGFVYIASLHESLPIAMRLSQMGIHGFALQYRTGDAGQACRDLARAVSFIFDLAEEWGIDPKGYSLWGASAGARMAAYVGSLGPIAFGADRPRPAAVIMEYTGYSRVSPDDPPTYSCVGTDDLIASPEVMKARYEALRKLGIPAEFHEFEGLGHGFGLGLGTNAEPWFLQACQFWMNNRQ